MSIKHTMMKPDMPNGCESESTRIAGMYLRKMLTGELSTHMYGRGNQNKLLWKKMYLGFMRKQGLIEANSRNAFQVLYALSRHYEVCHVEKNSITWTCDSREEAMTKLTIGELQCELHWVYGQLRRAENELNHTTRHIYRPAVIEDGECSDDEPMMERLTLQDL